MSRYSNRQELADKIDCEGGIFDMLFGYGLSADDLPSDDREIANAFAAIEAQRLDFDKAVNGFLALLPEATQEPAPVEDDETKDEDA